MGVEVKENVIAVDGLAGSGKGILTKALAQKFNIPAIDSGAIYRFITYYFKAQKIIENDSFVQELNAINLKYSIDKKTHQIAFFYNGDNIEGYIRNPEISQGVSYFSALKSVRQYITSFLRTIHNTKPLVMDGRDIGTCVYPKAMVKFFIVADIKIRAQRRLNQLLAKGIQSNYEDVFLNLIQRDHLDAQRVFCPLIKAQDAFQIDNSNISEPEFIHQALDYIEKNYSYNFLNQN